MTGQACCLAVIAPTGLEESSTKTHLATLSSVMLFESIGDEMDEGYEPGKEDEIKLTNFAQHLQQAPD